MPAGDLCGCAKLAPEPVRSVSPPHTSSPMHGCGEAGAPPASVPDDSDYVVAGLDSPHGQPPPHAIPRQATTDSPPPPPLQQVPQHCPTPPSSPLGPVHQLLHQLATDPSILSDTSPTSTRATTDVSPTEGTPSQSSVTPEMVQRGLGTAGHVEIASSLWQSCAPANFQWAADHAPQQRALLDPLLLMLASNLAESGLLCELPPHFLPNAKAYLKPKSAQKCAMIVNMIPINDHCLPPPPPFTLPHLDALAHTITVALLRRQPLFFTKLDISNMFWTCKMPAEHRHAVRIGVCGKVFSFPGLPFGWKASPAIAQKLLAMYIQHLYPGETVVVQYMDDILVVDPIKQHVQEQTDHLVRQFHANKWIVSPKSDLEPKHTMTSMGKDLDGLRGTVSTGASYLVGIVVLWLNLCTRGYHCQPLRRHLGKLQWALRPGRGAAPFLAGPYAWLHRGPPVAKCIPPPAVLRALAEAAAAAVVPWSAPIHPSCGPAWFVDAAGTWSGYWSAIWSPCLRPKIVQHHPWVNNQQAAELAGIVHAVRVAAYKGCRSLNVVFDNQAAICSAISGRTRIMCSAQLRLLRQLQHVLRWSGIQLACYWVPSVYNPADPPSRWWKYPEPIITDLEAWSVYASKSPFMPQFVAQTKYRG